MKPSPGGNQNLYAHQLTGIVHVEPLMLARGKGRRPRGMEIPPKSPEPSILRDTQLTRPQREIARWTGMMAGKLLDGSDRDPEGLYLKASQLQGKEFVIWPDDNNTENNIQKQPQHNKIGSDEPYFTRMSCGCYSPACPSSSSSGGTWPSSIHWSTYDQDMAQWFSSNVGAFTSSGPSSDNAVVSLATLVGGTDESQDICNGQELESRISSDVLGGDEGGKSATSLSRSFAADSRYFATDSRLIAGLFDGSMDRAGCRVPTIELAYQDGLPTRASSPISRDKRSGPALLGVEIDLNWKGLGIQLHDQAYWPSLYNGKVLQVPTRPPLQDLMTAPVSTPHTKFGFLLGCSGPWGGSWGGTMRGSLEDEAKGRRGGNDGTLECLVAERDDAVEMPDMEPMDKDTSDSEMEAQELAVLIFLVGVKVLLLDPGLVGKEEPSAGNLDFNATWRSLSISSQHLGKLPSVLRESSGWEPAERGEAKGVGDVVRVVGHAKGVMGGRGIAEMEW
ncbi:hypothetical protein EV421DRAFT_1744218 [Armillaria borealis]|uniref:Uncharacterized protein n=1 Tax=Armillaria borealis TaxID=47425 RepID=A0AA39ME18_9AGAR|nr:hypothetical protein EV421DRAFT_1744218 [Armillaria borealis]